ncbi:E3 ubiquitin-protein ligase Siah1-like [Periplaneta americana]|uniref:E3 ubiquitin-protein ligase Siah1-like n=1 Tax=Periplaneta americana TaxID=6978 RepID=UPI0037E701C8
MRRRVTVWGFIGQSSQESLVKTKKRTTVELRKQDLPDPSGMETVAVDLGQGLLSELECPVCMEYMLPPITFCLNGHNVCTNCKPQLTNCPTCRQPFVNIRNVALEKLARQMKYPCTYRKFGCKETFPPGLITQHQTRCRYSPQRCPLDRLRKLKCTWTGNASEVKKHLKDTHKDQCLEYNGRHSLVLSGIKASCGYFRLLFAYNEIFYRHFQIKDGVMYATLQYIGPIENASKFRYKVIFVNKKNTESIIVTHAARSISENLEDIFNSGNCLKLHYDVVNRFTNENSDLTIGMEIFKIDN